MSPVPFFVWRGNDADQEAAYLGLAEMVGRKPLPLLERIYSIQFEHNGDLWTATVGQPLSGVTLPYGSSRSKKPFYPQHMSDPAVVRAIFPGDPFLVTTNAGHSVRSAWANPFFAGSPRSVTLFVDASA